MISDGALVVKAGVNAVNENEAVETYVQLRRNGFEVCSLVFPVGINYIFCSRKIRIREQLLEIMIHHQKTMNIMLKCLFQIS